MVFELFHLDLEIFIVAPFVIYYIVFPILDTLTGWQQ